MKNAVSIDFITIATTLKRARVFQIVNNIYTVHSYTKIEDDLRIKLYRNENFRRPPILYIDSCEKRIYKEGVESGWGMVGAISL